jgi:hypothetical protein
MEAIGAIISVTLRILDAIFWLLYVLWGIVIGIPGVLRQGVGFWNKDKGKSDGSTRRDP